MTDMSPAYVLDRTPPPVVAVPVLDPSQQAVVDHRSGPLLVLAGPGTGKTTTLVEAVVERVRRGLTPDQVLVLTFSRKAAEELRERISGRIGQTTAEPAAWTFHAFCLALVTAYSGAPAPRLLSGPERLVRIRELLKGSLSGEGKTRWPDTMRAALDTRGMAREVADLLDRARERGVEPADLRQLADDEKRDDWRSAADFFEEYVDVLAAGGDMDYGELVRQALGLLTDEGVLADVRGRYRAVFVDEYQDTDPAQEELLRAIAGNGGDLVVVGDPDQSIYAFRGADVQCLLEFPERFPQVSGEPAPTSTLTLSRRAGERLLDASRRVAVRIPTPGLATDKVKAHRALTTDRDDDGVLELRLFSTTAEEAVAIADVLRRAHLEEGRPWRKMAVLVRSGKRGLPVIRRALTAAGVPIAVASDEVPVGKDPAVVPLLLALRCADDPGALDDEAARTLLTSPLGRMTPADLRRLGRALRAADRAQRGATDDANLALAAPSAKLIRDALAQPGDLLLVDEMHEVVTKPVERLAELLAKARKRLHDGGSAEEALWEIWNGSGWPRRLYAASATGGQHGRAADRDLDAVVALFDEFARMEERRPRAGVRTVLAEIEAQEIPAENRRDGSLSGADAVRVLTAHRSKGLEWDLVVVAGVQDGAWPDLRRRTSLLEADRIARTGVIDPPTQTQLLVEERRLFYVAITRARQRLVVTAVRSLDEDAERPSRFLSELGPDLPKENDRPAALLSTASVVARLRHAALDGDAAAAAQLARLAADVPAAHPDNWWGMHEWSPGARPVRPEDEPVRLSGSGVQKYEECPLAWFLDREAHAAQASTVAQGFGLVLHVLVRLVATGALPADVDTLLERLDHVWPSLGFEAPWQRDRERDEARKALRLFLAWHTGRPEREHVASEAAFDVEYAGTRLKGSIDRLERDDDGNIHVVDFKTGRNVPGKEEVKTNAQLGVYQIAVREGGFADRFGEDAHLGGAELVYLRKAMATGLPNVREQPPLDAEGGTWADELLERVAVGIAAEKFPARVNEGCERCVFARSCPAQEAGQQVVK
jgi:superfamily I DNA/RNA helicase/RecB family exonuclease